MTGNRLKRIILILIICFWLSILFIESAQAPAEIFAKVPGLDKVAHFFAFGVLSLLICGLSFNLKSQSKIPIFSMPLLIVSLAGALEESFQILTPGRIPSFADLTADITGALFAIILANRIHLFLNRKGGCVRS